MTYSYGRNPKLYEQMLNNEKKNFKIFHEKVSVELTIGGNGYELLPAREVASQLRTYSGFERGMGNAA